MTKYIFSFEGLSDNKIRQLIREARKEQKETKSDIYMSWVIQAQQEITKRNRKRRRNKIESHSPQEVSNEGENK